MKDGVKVGVTVLVGLMLGVGVGLIHTLGESIVLLATPIEFAETLSGTESL